MHKHKRPGDRKSLASSGNNEMFKFVKSEVRLNKSPDKTDPQHISQVQTWLPNVLVVFFP